MADSLDFSDVEISGDQVAVEIDETKSGKRKHNRGRIVDGVWVIGGIESTLEKKCFLIEVPDISAEPSKSPFPFCFPRFYCLHRLL
ncbi:hypothetical protein H311_01655 [Anncaliia algerae PRA109]|nr:hypothetical protein H311_01655 [Anncaliia algerae PRA109]